MNNQKLQQKLQCALAKLLITIMVAGLFTTPSSTTFAAQNGEGEQYHTGSNASAITVATDSEALEYDLEPLLLGAPAISPMLVGSSSNADVTGLIDFTATLSNSSGAAIATGSNSNFRPYYWHTFFFKINWEAVNANPGFEGGDYFTFTVPEIFAKIDTVYMTGDGGANWGEINFGTATDSNGSVTATATFNSQIDGRASLKGSIQLSGIYKGYTKGDPVTWVFDFSGASNRVIYEYHGTDVTNPTGNTDFTAQIFKRGEVGGQPDKYLWTVCLNEKMSPWSDSVTVKDTFGKGHTLTEHLSDSRYDSSGKISTSLGFHDVDGNGIPYFQIYDYDWEQMRIDYNSLYGDSPTLPYSGETISNSLYADGQVYERYRCLISSNPDVYSYDIPYGMVTRYMFDAMRNAKDNYGRPYYFTRYTGQVTAALTADGFILTFPAGDLDKKSLLIQYYTELTAKLETKELSNIVSVSGTTTGDDGAKSETINIGAVAFVSGTKGKITLYKSDQSESIFLENAVFQLTNSAGQSVTGTTDSRGELIFNLTDPAFTKAPGGIYTLTELTPPAGYLAPDNPIVLEVNTSTLKITTINGNPVGTNGATVPGICRVSSDGFVLDIYNTPESTSAPTSVTLHLTGTKTLSGKTLTDDMFSFIVTDENNNTVATTTNKHDGTITFPGLTCLNAGTYTYSISEVDSNVSNYTYDTAKYTVVVLVDEVNGALVITSLSVNGVNCNINDLSDLIKFNNKYTANDGGGGSSSGGSSSSGGGSTPGTGTDNTTPDGTSNLPSVSGGNALSSDGNGYVEINADGVPLGRWLFDEDTKTWIFDPMSVSTGSLPQTGDTSSARFRLLLSLSAGLLLIGIIMKKRFNNS